MKPNGDSGTVRYVRTARPDTKEYVLQYVRRGLRDDLKRAGNLWPLVALQIWSSLNPDPASRPTKPVADLKRYVATLVRLVVDGRFRPPPRVAQVRRDTARAERKRVAKAKRAEQRAIAEVTAALSRGEYPDAGAPAPRRRHG